MRQAIETSTASALRSFNADKPPRRLLIVGNGPTGIDQAGNHYLEQPCADILFELADRGFDIAFLQPVEPVERTLVYYGSALPPDRVEAIGLDRRTPSAAIRTSWQMLRSLLRADLVYIFYPGNLPRLVVALCRLLRKPYGLFLRGDGFDEQGADSPILRRAAFILAVSQVVADRARRANPNTTVIRSLSNVSASDIKERTFPRRGNGPARLLFVGRLEPAKGTPELLEAFALLRARGVAAELTLVGGGELHPELARRFAERPDPCIHLLGTVEDRARLMRTYDEHDILVLPTHSEGFPRVLYEALSRSNAVITTMVGGIPSVMKDEVNCLAIPVGDAPAIAGAVERLAGDPALMNRLTAAGRDSVRAIFENNPPHHIALARILGAAPSDRR